MDVSWVDIVAVVIAAAAAAIAWRGWKTSDKAANAAVESAESSKIAARVAETAEHERRAPKWELEALPRDDGGCVIRAIYFSGPPAVNLEIGYYGWYRSGPGGGVGRTTLTHRTERFEPVAKREPIDLPIERPSGWDFVEEVKIYVTLISVTPSPKDEEEPPKPWFDASYLRWLRDEPLPTSPGLGSS